MNERRVSNNDCDKAEDAWTTVKSNKNKTRNNNKKLSRKRINQINMSKLATKCLQTGLDDEDGDAGVKQRYVSEQIRTTMSVLRNHAYFEELLPFVKKAVSYTTVSESHKYDDNDGSGQFETHSLHSKSCSSVSTRAVKEIVCYGIGNFSKPYSPPMLQLACALLLRESFSKPSPSQESDKFENDDNKESKTVTISGCIPMSFYDPCTTKSEKEILQKYFNIIVIPCNEQGKRKLQHCDEQKVNTK